MQQILYAANIIFGGRLCPGEYISSEISLLLLIQRVMLNAENLGRIFAVACTRKKCYLQIFDLSVYHFNRWRTEILTLSISPPSEGYISQYTP